MNDRQVASPSLPPLLTGVAVQGAADPFVQACALAAEGCDGGTLVHNVQIDRLRAALVFAPEVPLHRAIAMLPVCGVGAQNALGALAPPEVAMHLGWDGTILVNGARCGALQVAVSDPTPDAVPDWLVIGLELAILQISETPGATPEVTTLQDEGCGDIDPLDLLEAWARHALVWIRRWEEDGTPPVHQNWSGLVPGIGAAVDIAGLQGTFLGVDEDFGMLLKDGAAARLVPLTWLLGERT